MGNDSKLITIYIPKNKAEYLVVKALLDSSGVECFAFNVDVQSLIGAGAIFNIGAGAIKIQVREENVEEAIKLINAEPQLNDPS